MQPWATLLFHGKNIENRTCATKYRGELLIHASAKPVFKFTSIDQVLSFLDKEQVADLKDYNEIGPMSAIIGKVDLVDCVINHPSVWAEQSPYLINPKEHPLKPIHNWVFENPVLFEEPILNVKGKLNLWNYEMETDIEDDHFDMFRKHGVTEIVKGKNNYKI